jgi:hypothetical protein
MTWVTSQLKFVLQMKETRQINLFFGVLVNYHKKFGRVTLHQTLPTKDSGKNAGFITCEKSKASRLKLDQDLQLVTDFPY